MARFATDLTGLTDRDPQAAYWVVRVVLSLMYWPAGDDETERQVVQRFVAPAFAWTAYSLPNASYSAGRKSAR
jgi:hypothetical protein